MECMNTASIVGIVIGVVFGLIESAYMVYIRVPAVLEIRPELADAGLRTGLFGGREASYLYYHYPVAMTIISCALFAVALFIATLK